MVSDDAYLQIEMLFGFVQLGVALRNMQVVIGFGVNRSRVKFNEFLDSSSRL